MSLKGQYSIDDKELVRATFLRDGSNPIFLNYLQSGDQRKTKAAILSLANLNDTSLHSELVKLDFQIYGKLICFAFGCNTPTSISLNFLKEKAISEESELIKDVLEALGKIGTKEELENILQLPVRNNVYVVEGISLAVANFALRSIRSEKSSDLLMRFIRNENYDHKTKYFAAYSLFRSRPQQKDADELKNILEIALRDNASQVENTFIKYLILNLKFLKVSASTPEVILKHYISLSFSSRVDIISTLQYYNYTKGSEVDDLLSLLKDQNPNIGVTVASILKNISFDTLLLKSKYSDFESALFASLPNKPVFSELLPSFLSLFKDKRKDIFAKLSNEVTPQLFAFLLSNFPEIINSPLDTLISIYTQNNEIVKLTVASAMGELKKKNIEPKKINEFALTQLNSGLASVVSTFCEILDSIFVSENKNAIYNQILSVMNSELNNPNFFEAHQSLLKLSESISLEFTNSIKELLANSSISSIQKLSGTEIKNKNLSNFEGIWINAFKYNKAIFETESGSFTLELYPEYAPISVGNFVTLVQTSFYRNVIFHRVVPGFVIQAGDPSGTGWGGPGYDIISEYSPLEFTTGAFGMASAGKDTEGSQFFVMQGTFPHLTTRYSLFGRVTDGQGTVNNVPQNSVIKKISLFE